MKVCVVNKSNHRLSEYSTTMSAGMDLKTNISEPITLGPLQRILIPTGLYMAIPEGYELQIRPRSGLALKHGITVVNTPGTIDAVYRGNIGVILKNDGIEPFIIEQGDRIAQGVLNKVEEANLIETDSLDETDRSDSGYGKSGVK